MKYFVYIVKCSDGSFYTGYTTNVSNRINMHNTSKRGAKYTYTRRPVTLVYKEEFQALSEALKREHAIKILSHKEKLALILGSV